MSECKDAAVLGGIAFVCTALGVVAFGGSLVDALDWATPYAAGLMIGRWPRGHTISLVAASGALVAIGGIARGIAS